VLKITVSIGVAQSGALNADPEAVLAMADKALFRAKHHGRNAVCR
jgi:PleD family two-component response regulator